MFGSSRRRGWSDAEDNALLELAASGRSMRLIGLRLKRSTAAVKTRLAGLGALQRTKADAAQEYVVVAQKHDGALITLKTGFASREDAEDHPIKLSEWKQVWVQPVDILLPSTE